MAENATASTPASMSSAPQPAAGAQNQQFDVAQGNGQTNPSHMPPPPRPPVVIPQNTNPIPTAITSPISGNMMSPTSAGGYVRRAAPEPNKRALYVGGLDPRVTEDILKQIFETTGHVVSVKIIPDKNVSDSVSNSLSSSPRHQLGAMLAMSFVSYLQMVYRCSTDACHSSTARATTMVLSNSMTQVLLSEPCRP